MIPGFTEHTAKLNDEEKRLAERLALTLNTRVGKDMAITNARIRKLILEKADKKVDDSRVRKMINYIRWQNLCDGILIGSNKGYYVTQNLEEAKEGLHALRERHLAMIATYGTMKELFRHYFGSDPYPEDNLKVYIKGKCASIGSDYTYNNNIVRILTKTK